MIKNKRKCIFIGITIVITVMLTGCTFWDNEVGKMKEALKGREATIQTYDDESKIIDKINGKSISISQDKKFNITDSEGNTTKQSKVLDITVGGKEMIHVGSSLVLYEDGLNDIFNDYTKTVKIDNIDRSVPLINTMVNNIKNFTSGKSKIVLIRSQSGKPLASFAGNKVGCFATGVPSSTGIQIDGKYLFIYRCDYTIYDTDLLN